MHGFAGVDGEGQHIAGLVIAIGRCLHAGHRRWHGIDAHQAGITHTRQGGAGIVADAVAQGRAIEFDAVAQGDAVAVELAVDHRQAEHQRGAARAGQVVGVGRDAIVQDHLQAWRASAGIQQHRFIGIDDEVQVLASDVSTVGRHLHADHAWRDAVDAVAGTGQAAADGVAGGIDDTGAATGQVQAQAALATQAIDQHGVSAPIQRGDAADAASGAAAEDEVEVAGVHAADGFTEGHAEAHRAGIVRAGIDAHDAAGARCGGVYVHPGSAAHAVQGKVQVIAGQVRQRLATQVEAADRDAIAVVVARLDDVLEHQRRRATARHVVGITGDPAHIQRQTRRQCAGLHGFAGVDGEGQHIAGLVVALQRRRHTHHRWGNAVDIDSGSTGHIVQGGNNGVARQVADGAAIELDAATYGNAIAVELAVGHGHAEYQGSATGPGYIVSINGAAVIQGDSNARHPAKRIEHHLLAEVDGEIQVLAGDVSAVGRCLDARHPWQHTVDHNIAAPTKRVAGPHARQSKDRQVIAGIGQNRAVELQRCRALEVQVGTDIPCLHGVLEHQCIAARAARVNRRPINQASLQQQARNPTGGIGVDHLVENHVDQHFITHLHSAVQPLGRDAGDSGVQRDDVDRKGIDIGSRPTASTVAIVIGLDGEGGAADEVASRGEGKGLQGCIEVGTGTLEDHQRVIASRPQQQSDTAEAAKAEGAIGRAQEHG